MGLYVFCKVAVTAGPPALMVIEQVDFKDDGVCQFVLFNITFCSHCLTLTAITRNFKNISKNHLELINFLQNCSYGCSRSSEKYLKKRVELQRVVEVNCIGSCHLAILQ